MGRLLKLLFNNLIKRIITIASEYNDLIAKCFIWIILFNYYQSTVLRGLHRLCDIIFLISLRNKSYYYLHFTGEDTTTSFHKANKQKCKGEKKWRLEPRAFLREILSIFI